MTELASRKGMGLDSVELVMDVEKEFELTIPDEAAAKLVTVGLLYDYLCEHSPRLRGKCSAREYSGWAWDRLEQLVVEQIGVDPSLVRPDAYFVRDLGMD